MPLPSPRALLFDFDYTLADSSDGIVRCTNHALEQLGFPAADPDAIRRTIGLPLETMFRLLTGQPPAAPPEFRRHFVACADEVMVPSTSFYPGVPEAVRALAAGGVRLGIVTTKYAYRVQAVLRRDGLEEVFGTVIGSDGVAAPKPDPAGLHLALARLGAEREQALFVGDSTTDAEAARRADVAFIGVLTGPTSRAELEAYPQVGVLASAADLPAWLRDRSSSP